MQLSEHLNSWPGGSRKSSWDGPASKKTFDSNCGSIDWVVVFDTRGPAIGVWMNVYKIGHRSPRLDTCTTKEANHLDYGGYSTYESQFSLQIE